MWVPEVNESVALFEWHSMTGVTTITFSASLKRFLMCVTTAKGIIQEATMDSYFLEAEDLTGPWRLIDYLPLFGQQAYFLNWISKFEKLDTESAVGVPGAYSGMLSYSADFTGRSVVAPRGGRYGLVIAEAMLVKI